MKKIFLKNTSDSTRNNLELTNIRVQVVLKVPFRVIQATLLIGYNTQSVTPRGGRKPCILLLRFYTVPGRKIYMLPGMILRTPPPMGT